jgi:hypothetical protein
MIARGVAALQRGSLTFDFLHRLPPIIEREARPELGVFRSEIHRAASAH